METSVKVHWLTVMKSSVRKPDKVFYYTIALIPHFYFYKSMNMLKEKITAYMEVVAPFVLPLL